MQFCMDHGGRSNSLVDVFDDSIEKHAFFKELRLSFATILEHTRNWQRQPVVQRTLVMPKICLTLIFLWLSRPANAVIYSGLILCLLAQLHI